MKNEAEVDGTNMDDYNDLQEMQKMIENTFQLMFKRKWKKCIEEQKLEHPTWSFSYSSTVKSTVMFLKCQDEQLKLQTYDEMLKQELREHAVAQDKLVLLMNRLKSLLKEKPVHSETEAKVVDAVIEKNEATVRYHEIKMQLLQTKIDEHSHNAEEWSIMVTTHKKELQKELQLGKQQERNV